MIYKALKHKGSSDLKKLWLKTCATEKWNGKKRWGETRVQQHTYYPLPHPSPHTQWNNTKCLPCSEICLPSEGLVCPFTDETCYSGPDLHSQAPSSEGAHGIVRHLLVPARHPESQSVWTGSPHFTMKGAGQLEWGLFSDFSPQWTRESPESFKKKKKASGQSQPKPIKSELSGVRSVFVCFLSCTKNYHDFSA